MLGLRNDEYRAAARAEIEELFSPAQLAAARERLDQERAAGHRKRVADLIAHRRSYPATAAKLADAVRRAAAAETECRVALERATRLRIDAENSAMHASIQYSGTEGTIMRACRELADPQIAARVAKWRAEQWQLMWVGPQIAIAGRMQPAWGPDPETRLQARAQRIRSDRAPLALRIRAITDAIVRAEALQLEARSVEDVKEALDALEQAFPAVALEPVAELTEAKADADVRLPRGVVRLGEQ